MRRVLLAEDDPASRVLLESVLTEHGFRVHSCPDGEGALAVLDEVVADVVVLDVGLPGLDGIEICRRIKQGASTRLTPVVLVSACGERQKRLRGIEAGADDFLTKPVDHLELVARVHSLSELKRYTDELDRAEETLFALAKSIEGRDPCTAGHCERLAYFAAAVGQQLGLGPQEIEALRRAGIVHDIGKVAVPDAILLKPGPLSAEERVVMQQHPLVGERICTPLRSLRRVLPIIRHHHERWNGTGYPDGLAGEAIPLTARILHVVDIYDALRAERPYKRELPRTEAMAILRGETEGGLVDPQVVAALNAVLLDQTWLA